ncbi:caffeine-induced death protein 2 [Bisporella sp. PMI_857]|nr:caffeine-induced death protein 2 [Bisporella sp. PMI_857]
MNNPITSPQLTPQFCFSTVALRDFLRMSRSIDDSITPNLNALFPPSPGFSPQQYPRTFHKRQLSSSACQSFKNQVLFPSWQVRSDVLNYCASVATSPDPDDPESVLRLVESERRRERVVDERLDPYSGRWFPKEARTERLADMVRQERSVEGIVRTRTWRLVGERCGEELRGWEEALNDWRTWRER